MDNGSLNKLSHLFSVFDELLWVWILCRDDGGVRDRLYVCQNKQRCMIHSLYVHAANVVSYSVFAWEPYTNQIMVFVAYIYQVMPLSIFLSLSISSLKSEFTGRIMSEAYR
jgi:hypothetical protein